ncbi:MAG: tetratricopeptide repeat protein [Ekhidna sp.]
MKYIFIFFTILSSHLIFANSIADRASSISSLIGQYPDSAYSLAEDLMIEALKRNDEYGIVQSNFILAYIHDEIKGEYGKAIIYYLEAIRYAEESSYDNVSRDLISLHKNCGVIFRKFKSYTLAEEYYNKAFEHALETENEQEKQSINYNISGLLMDQERFNEAVVILTNLISKTSIDSRNYWKYNNRLGLALYEFGDYESAIEAHNNSLAFTSLSNKYHAYAMHNIGRCFSSLNNFNSAYSHFNKALEMKQNLSNQSTLFSTYSELGNLSLKNGEVKKALKYFNQAEKYIDQIGNLDYYELFKSKADALFLLKDFNEAKKYEDLHSESLNKYLEVQKDIQEIDKRYNMDLITKRYFDKVEKQERIAHILWWSKLISGSLLGMLLFTIGFNRYQKVQLRKSIVQDLIKLKVID